MLELGISGNNAVFLAIDSKKAHSKVDGWAYSKIGSNPGATSLGFSSSAFHEIKRHRSFEPKVKIVLYRDDSDIMHSKNETLSQKSRAPRNGLSACRVL